MKKIVVVIACLCAVVLITPACAVGIYQESMKKNNTQNQSTSQSRYWGLLFAVGVYLNAPDMDRPSMLEACDDLYATLLDSPQYWQASNIHVLKGSQAILQNLIRELLWLRKNANSEDYVLVYLTTHGNHLYNAQSQPWDLPPKDEADGSDELLVMYNGFDQWYGIIWDDLLNFFLSLIKCKGLCLIVDSCYSGGFNDPPHSAVTPEQYSAKMFTSEFMHDVRGQNRIVLMSTQENLLSYGSVFSDFLTVGFQGYADSYGNQDGINSAEESFAFAAPWTELFSYGEEIPTISDQFPGEFPVTT